MPCTQINNFMKKAMENYENMLRFHAHTHLFVIIMEIETTATTRNG